MKLHRVRTFLKRCAAHPAFGSALAFCLWLVPCQSPPLIPEWLNIARFAGALVAAGAAAVEMRRRRDLEEIIRHCRSFGRSFAGSVAAFFLVYYFLVVHLPTLEGTAAVPVGIGPNCCENLPNRDCVRRLNLSADAVQRCWGGFSVASVYLGLVASYWWTAGAGGSLLGLLLLRSGTGWVRKPDVTALQPLPSEAAEAELAVQRELKRKRAKGDFDVFLCHNSADKTEVKKIGEQLKRRGILPWLDMWELQPGKPWQRLLEEQIRNIKSAAVFVGSAGLGPWQHQELDGFLRMFVARQSPVIPVLLPNAPEMPELPLFLTNMTWVDFRIADPDPLDHLIFGITGKWPERLGQ